MRIVFAAAAVALGSSIICAPTATAIPGYQSCGPYNGYQIDVRNVACEDAWLVDAYDWVSGPKFQTIAAYDCYTGTAAVRPIVLTCVSPDGELVVSE
ncbi:MAG TPA: hypothetical protein VJR50_11210 [Mycobacterium sp.]|jgi:hypothetical protein|nr:hypothetical protein [Mycobacterium sp.]